MSKLKLGLLFSFFICLALGQLQRWQVTPTIAVYAHDLVIVITLLVIGWEQRRGLSKTFHEFSPGKIWEKNKLPIALGAVAVTSLLVATLTTGLSSLVAWLYLARFFTYGLFSYAIATYGPLPKLDIRWGYTATGVMVAGLGLLQYLLMPDTRFLAILGWDDHYYRLISTWFDPGFTGLGLVLTFVLLEDFRRWFSRMWITCLQAGVVMAILLTYSRSSWLSLIVTTLGLVFVWGRRTNKKLSELLPVGLAVGLLLTSMLWLPKPTGEGVDLGRTSTLVARQTSFTTSVGQLTPVQWVIGRGVFVPFPTLTAPPQGQPDHGRQADNILIWSLSGLGLIGTGLLLFQLVKWGKVWWHQSPLVVVAVAATLTHGLFNNSLWQPFIFLFLTGIVATADQKL